MIRHPHRFFSGNVSAMGTLLILICSLTSYLRRRYFHAVFSYLSAASYVLTYIKENTSFWQLNIRQFLLQNQALVATKGSYHIFFCKEVHHQHTDSSRTAQCKRAARCPFPFSVMKILLPLNRVTTRATLGRFSIFSHHTLL